MSVAQTNRAWVSEAQGRGFDSPRAYIYATETNPVIRLSFIEQVLSAQGKWMAGEHAFAW